MNSPCRLPAAVVLLVLSICVGFGKEAVGMEQKGPQIKIAHVWSDKPLAKTGDTIKFSAFVENTGGVMARNVSVELKAPEGITVSNSVPIAAIPAGSYRRLDWTLKAVKSGASNLEVTASCGPAIVKASYRILVIARSAKYTRQELCTDNSGCWRILDRPSSLQQGNIGALTPIKNKKSSEIKRNTYGVCTHVPRSKDYEAPFNRSHLIDGDPESCWSSQQNCSPYPRWS